MTLWNEIESSYQEYLDRYPNEGMIGTPGEYPFRWMVNSKGKSGYIAYNSGELERKYLLTYRDDLPDISELPMDELAKLPVNLVRILQIQRAPDHSRTWSMLVHILREVNEDDDPIHDEIAENIESMVQAILAFQPSTSVDRMGDPENSILSEAPVFARYMAYPTLEGMIKSLCRADIEMDGTVRRGRTVLRYDDVDHYCGGMECGHIGHLLWHFEQQVVEEPLRSRLIGFREAYAEFYDGVSPDRVYGDITRKRNSVLHGAIEAQAEFGILITFITLIIFNMGSIPKDRRTIAQ